MKVCEYVKEFKEKQSFNYGTIFLGDTRRMIKSIPSESIDLVYTDPPYGVIKNDSLDDVTAFYSILDELYRVCKKDAWMVLWFATSKLDELFRSVKQFKYVWTITCFNAGSGYLGKTPIGDRKVSYILVFRKGNPKLNWKISDLVVGYEGFRVYGQINTLHKPTSVHIYLLNAFANRDAIVLDCFSGYGSIPMTCEWLRINWIGFEIDEQKYKIACNSIRDGIINMLDNSKGTHRQIRLCGDYE